MADAIVSAVAQRLTDMVAEQIREEVSLVRGVKKEVRNLSSDLKNVRKLLDDAERKGCTSESVRGWLRRLENATYEMDDILDEWNLALIKFRMQQSDAPPQEEKVCPFIPHSSCLGFKKIATRRDIALKIKYIKAQLDEILKERNRYDFLENQETSHSLVRVTTSFVEMDDIKGRDIDKDNLVNKITSHSTSSGQGDQLGPIHISSIVGTGGIGKTTLAQLIYNDKRVQNCFPLRIWICVSDPFDEANIAKEIIGKAGGSAPSSGSLDGLLELVQESILGKKILLILDDVWSSDDAKWGPLKSSLKSSCAAGSRILVTTRNEMVARNIGTNENEIHRLDQLSDDECWLLLSHIAFSEKSEGMKKGFLDIGRRIAQKCRGLPLAAKTLGSLLRFKSTVEEWEDVLDSEIWRLKSTKVDLFPHLLLSYNDLSPTEKRCFSYCAVFPKDHEIEVDDLIRKWMALRYLSSDDSNASELELKGREYFNSLANRSLFQNFEKDPSSENVISKCKMHDIVHDFAKSLREEDDLKHSEEPSSCKICSHLVSSVKEYRSLLLDGDEEQCDLHVDDCLRIVRVLECRRFENISMEIEKFFHLRNLSFYEVNVNENDIRIICSFYNLQSLVLVNCKVREFPSEIGNLSQLRHLNLSRNRKLKVFPESISNLHELRSLDVSKCSRLSELPQGIDWLINLKRLLVDSDRCIKYPQGLAKLTSLQTLGQSIQGMFYGGGNWNNLGFLNTLNRLSGSLKLRIQLVGDDDSDIVEQAREAKLRKKMHLQKLTIEFHDNPNEEDKEEDQVRMRRRFDVMDALEPQPDLQSLGIYCYRGSKFPEWIASPSFHQLTKLELFSCISCLSLPHLGKLPSLEELEIYDFSKVELVGREFLHLPKLKKLEFRYCGSWKEWEDITEEEGESAAVSVMPCLMELVIDKCPKLKELPHRLLRNASSLQRLTIPLQLRKSYKEDGGPLNKFISHIPNVDVSEW